MKKIIFYIIFLIIGFAVIELGSWSTIKIYKLLKYPKENNNKKSEVVVLDNQSTSDFEKYYAFYGWKKKDIVSEKINVQNNLRKTRKNPNWDLKSKIWFFGGSTIWGAIAVTAVDVSK